MGKGRLRQDAVRIFSAGLAVVEPGRAIRSHLSRSGRHLIVGDHRIDLHPEGKIYVVGAGKAAGSMAAAVEEILGDRISEGVVAVKDGYGCPTRMVKVRPSGHPIPDDRGRETAWKVAGLLEKAGEKDVVICLISGGGSALLPFPAPPVDLSALEETTRVLVNSGADIGEINAVRKHLSGLAGGQLSRLAWPAKVGTLILSDVVGDPLDVIASGPTVPDPTTFGDCLSIIERYGLKSKVPSVVLDRLRRGAEGQIPETPKPGDEIFNGTVNVLIGNNRLAVKAAAAEAKSLGYAPLILSTTVVGEAREVARAYAAMARGVVETGNPVSAPACLLSGGETTVTVTGTGTGGRNQEFVLAASLEIAGLEGAVILSAGTDGTDGFTDAAGAIADGKTADRIRAAGLDPRECLMNNDSHPALKAAGDLVVTGPTHTNVMDLQIVLIGPDRKTKWT